MRHTLPFHTGISIAEQVAAHRFGMYATVAASSRGETRVLTLLDKRRLQVEASREQNRRAWARGTSDGKTGAGEQMSAPAAVAGVLVGDKAGPYTAKLAESFGGSDNGGNGGAGQGRQWELECWEEWKEFGAPKGKLLTGFLNAALHMYKLRPLFLNFPNAAAGQQSLVIE
ncbi:hypothetical protein E5D57_000905 [Metarhizium anisopliae]|nr:hypothetical protein E5D57_000905 [Metarhizium anisopliae]